MRLPAFLSRRLQATKQTTISNSDIKSHAYPQLVIRFISFILSHPKLIVILPALLVFVISYDVVYDFTIKQVNGELATVFSDFSVNSLLDHQLYHNDDLYYNPLITRLSHIDVGAVDPSHLSLSKIVLSSTDVHNFNVLQFDFLNQVNSLVQNLQYNSSYPPLIVSPIPTWHLNLNAVSNITLSGPHKTKIERFVLKTLNFDQNSQLLTLFFNNIFKYNHFVEKAQLLQFYAIHDSGDDMLACLSHRLSNNNTNYPLLAISDVATTNSPVSVKDFVDYYLLQNHQVTSADLFIGTMEFLQLLSLISFIVYVFLSVANQHKIRSNLGLIVGWTVEILISVTASINIISHIHNYKSWRLVFEPSTTFTRAGYVFTVMILSSRCLFRMINDIAGDNSFEVSNDIHKRLFKFYLGVNVSVKNSTTKLEVIDTIFGLFGINLRKLYVPNITKVLLINIFGIVFMNFVGTSLFKFYFDGVFMQYLSMRLLRFIEAVIIALIIDHLLQLTYLVGIIIVDLNRYELKDLLDSQGKLGNSSASNYENTEENSSTAIYEVNAISSFLLQLKKPAHSRPGKDSLRYKLGQYLLKVRPSSSATFWFLLLPLIELLHFLCIFTHWVIMIPYNLINDPQKIVSIGFRNIIVNKNNLMYYLELLTFISLILAVSQLIFKVAHYKVSDIRILQRDAAAATTTGGSHNKSSYALSRLNGDLTLGDFELRDEVKFFKSVDLFEPVEGHSLDVLKIITNSGTSFPVSFGLDHKVLIWSPLSKDVAPKPINISSTVTNPSSVAATKKREFWPINHISISNDGNYIILINFKFGLMRCFQRDELKFIWQYEIPREVMDRAPNKKVKILESFFRKRTVPGFLTRKILQKKKTLLKSKGGAGMLSGRSRRGSDVSINSFSSHLNANFPPPPPSMSTTDNNDTTNDHIQKEIQELEKSLHKEDFTLVLATGELITISCQDGNAKITNVCDELYDDLDENGNNGTGDKFKHSLTAATKIFTSRVSDRIVFYVSNYDIIVATVINNNWKLRKLPVQEESYNKGLKVATPLSLSLSSPAIDRDNFKSRFDERESNSKLQQQQQQQQEDHDHPGATGHKYAQINKPEVLPIEFVGMMLRVIDLTAQLIDVQTGVILKTFNIGHFKPSTLRVSHSEPTHCKFCGCASVQSFSIIYEDFYDKTIIMHTFKLEAKRSKNNICLRVERDPREIRCVGFNGVIERQYWYENVESWELTDVNMIIGFKRKLDESTNASSDDEEEGVEMVGDNDGFSSGNRPNLSSLIASSGLASLRSRKDDTRNRHLFSKSYNSLQNKDSKVSPTKVSDIWQGFIITAVDGKLIKYEIPDSPDGEGANNVGLIANRINSISKYGFKAVAVSFGNLIKILYLGNDKLIENELYYSGTDTTIGSIFDESNDNGTRGVASAANDGHSRPGPASPPGTNSNELLFINKRRRMREKQRSSKLTTVVRE